MNSANSYVIAESLACQRSKYALERLSLHIRYAVNNYRSVMHAASNRPVLKKKGLIPLRRLRFCMLLLRRELSTL
jgi:hypothetical protein